MPRTRKGRGISLSGHTHTRRMQVMPVVGELRVAACCERGRALASLS
jgi:hypothetical protein